MSINHCLNLLTIIPVVVAVGFLIRVVYVDRKSLYHYKNRCHERLRSTRRELLHNGHSREHHVLP